jgi:hypothetical protein
MTEGQCQGDGCTRSGTLRSLVDNVQHCVWRFILCDYCNDVLQDYEKFAVARGKGERVAAQN